MRILEQPHENLARLPIRTLHRVPLRTALLMVITEFPVAERQRSTLRPIRLDMLTPPNIHWITRQLIPPDSLNTMLKNSGFVGIALPLAEKVDLPKNSDHPG